MHKFPRKSLMTACTRSYCSLDPKGPPWAPILLLTKGVLGVLVQAVSSPKRLTGIHCMGLGLSEGRVWEVMGRAGQRHICNSSGGTHQRPQIYLLCSSLIPNPPGARDALSLAPTNPPVLRNALRWCRFGGLLPVRGEVGLMEYPFF